jgi:polysaccharide export outer membrane protein
MSRQVSRWLLAGWLVGGLTSQPMLPVLAASPPQAAPSAGPGYVLRYGDTLSICMLGNETFKLENQAIRPDGRLSVPLLGEVDAGGLTIPQLTAALTQGYRRYVIDPRLVVNIANFRPLKINVLGLVNKPGTYAVPEPTDLFASLALAGGLTRDRADARAIEVRRADGRHAVVNLERILAGEQENTVLEDGDTVIVAEVAGPDWERILPHMATALSILGSLAVITWNIRN